MQCCCIELHYFIIIIDVFICKWCSYVVRAHFHYFTHGRLFD